MTSRAKQFISLDQNSVYRIHKLKGLRLMADKDFTLTSEDLHN